jgi:FlaA1/EpsC-like NDP-sugar epimerase
MIKTVGTANLILVAFNFLSFVQNGAYLYPTSIIIISLLFTLGFLLGYRFLVKELFEYGVNSYAPRKSVVIFGAGMAGRTTAQLLQDNKASGYQLKAFLDDNSKLANTRIHGKLIINPEKSLKEVFDTFHVDELIIAIQDISIERRRWIIEECLKYSVTVRQVPSVDHWVGGNLQLNQIRDIKIEDLLGREPITVASKNAIDQFSGRVILVTGAAGSIGSEISNQLVKCGPLKLLLLDQAESPLHDLYHDLLERYKSLRNVEVIICDVTNKTSVDEVFRKHRPEVVFHAAAYKHVPLMESMPFEAVGTNVIGTKLLADLSVKYGAKKFVLISTDKAVNPTNIMGATKRAAEMYVQSLSAESEQTEFITTRFGNVLGSNGSVIPLFRKQIQKGGPLTVTHPEITRFFMTIPEACSLVLEAETMGKGGEIFVFDMGESIKILDLARKMVKLAGLELGKDIDIEFSGLRPGEKLYEEVLSDRENTKQTHHPKIMIADVEQHDYERINLMILSIQKSLNERNEFEMVRKLKRLVPEFKSKISRFEILDR